MHIIDLLTATTRAQYIEDHKDLFQDQSVKDAAMDWLTALSQKTVLFTGAADDILVSDNKLERAVHIINEETSPKQALHPILSERPRFVLRRGIPPATSNFQDRYG